jgi:hypothetical protein
MNRIKLYPIIVIFAGCLALVYVSMAEKPTALSNAAFRVSSCGHPKSQFEIMQGVQFFREKRGYSWGYSADTFGDLICFGKTVPAQTYSG